MPRRPLLLPLLLFLLLAAFGVHPARATSLVPPGLDPNLRATVEARGGPQRAGVCPGAATVLPLMLILGVVAAVMSLARDHAF